MNAHVGQTLKYIALPGIVSRVKGLRLDFGYIAYLMALIFSIVRLLPETHPYLMPVNMGRFSVRQVLAAAAHNLKGGFRNIDQYIIYGGFLLGIVILIMQFVVLFTAIAISGAHAAGYLGDFGAFFHTPRPAADVAFMLLDTVFQIPGFFNSVAGPENDAAITPVANGMHWLFSFYSGGMLCIAGLIIVYYVFVVIVESAQTGVPFGERFDSVYVPIRLVLAIMLLLPTYYGMNSGQWIALKLAKYGSSFATNAWMIHNNTVLTNPYGVGTNNPLGLTTRNLVASPKIEDVGSIISFFMLYHACESAYYWQYASITDDDAPKNISAYFVRKGGAQPSASLEVAGQAYNDALAFFNNGPIKIVFGEHSDTYTEYDGHVKPYCGSMVFPVDSVNYEGARDIYETYYNYIVDNLITDDNLIAYGDREAFIQFRDRGDPCTVDIARDWGAGCDEHAGAVFSNSVKTEYQAVFDGMMRGTIDTLRDANAEQLTITRGMLDLGWGGAGVWFGRISEYNGAIVTASLNKPQTGSFPLVMEYVAEQKMKNQNSGAFKDRYNPNFQENTTADQYFQQSGLDNSATDLGMAKYLDATYRRLESNDLTQDPGNNSERLSKNPLINVINAVYGSSGLFDLRQNIDVHPMARLSALGRGIIDKSIMYLGGALVMSGLGGMLGAADQHFNKGFDTLSSALAGIGMTGLTVGFIFYYIIPLMPFMYFFFACARWVKTIFEAMVGIPLWALAHLKIDGEGIPAQAAANGYFLLLEIFIRPILTVFGLLLGFSIFAAMVVVLDTIFNVVVANVGGYSNLDKDGNPNESLMELARSALDEFMYTIVYAIIVYMIATSSFKLIDLIPNGILRFAGAGVASFGDKAPDPMESLTKYTALAGSQMTGSATEAIKGLGNAVGGVVGGVGRMAMDAGSGQGGGAAGRATSEMAQKIRNEAGLKE